MKWAKLLDGEDDDGDTIGGGGGDGGESDDETSNLYKNVAAVRAVDVDGNIVTSAAAATNNDDNNGNVKITQLSVGAQSIPLDVSQKITSQLLKQAQQQQQEEQIRKKNVRESVAALNDFIGDTSIDEADYETMYRTLMSLPVEERVTLNLPEYPIGGAEGGDDDGGGELDVFIDKVKEIWGQRQAMLKKVEEEYLANVPDLIRDRIFYMKRYVASPLHYLKGLIDHGSVEDVSGDGPTNIVEILEDLEFHLMDLDMTRDFHTMGGWPLLVSLLTDDIHGLDDVVRDVVLEQNWTDADYDPNDGGTISVILPESKQLYIQTLRETIWNVQALACWCVGTAVKNIDEFHSWALEDMSDFLQFPVWNNATEPSSTQVNAISILLSKLAVNGDNMIDSTLVASKPWLKLKQKELYAIGALLRGNDEAIHYFHSLDGFAILSRFFHGIILGSENNSALTDGNVVKLLIRIFVLGVDLITESKDDNEILSSLLTDESWCSMPLKLMHGSSASIQRQVLEGMLGIKSRCNFQKDDVSTIEFADDPDIRDFIDRIYENVSETIL